MASPNTSGAIARITKEIAHIQKGTDLSLAVACREKDVRHVRALIIGPPETPYEFGFFEFDIKFGKEYPIKSPHVRSITTNSGRTRFNPNIYNCGKVCLSILGTWRGNPGEEWSSAQGLESVLLSIQSLMSQNPYENEPGFETAKKEEQQPIAYCQKIAHETLRIAVIQRMEELLDIDDNKIPAIYKNVRSKTQELLNQQSPGPSLSNGDGDDGASTPATDTSAYEYDAEATFNALDSGMWDPFSDLLKRRFLWYYDTYRKNVDSGLKTNANGEAFTRTDFEHKPNTMDGHFEYTNLGKRLKKIMDALEDERKAWAKQGAAQVKDGTQLATQLFFQFRQLANKWNEGSYSGSRMEISLPFPEHPFTWHLTLFGKPMTNLDGGIFNMTLSIPPNFPDCQPRVVIDTEIFHHRVNSIGVLCYFPQKEDEIGSHLEAIVTAIEDENPNFDPRATVNPGAFALYWGGDEKRKFYNRRLRRSAQESIKYPGALNQLNLHLFKFYKMRLNKDLSKLLGKKTYKHLVKRQHRPPAPFDFWHLKFTTPEGETVNRTISRDEPCLMLERLCNTNSRIYTALLNPVHDNKAQAILEDPELSEDYPEHDEWEDAYL